MMTIALLEDLKDLASMIQDIVEAEPDMSCRQVYHTAEDAIRFLPQNPTDILVVDIGLPRASGIEAMQTLGLLCPAMQFCMFTVYEDDEKIFRSLQAGAISSKVPLLLTSFQPLENSTTAALPCRRALPAACWS